MEDTMLKFLPKNFYNYVGYHFHGAFWYKRYMEYYEESRELSNKVDDLLYEIQLLEIELAELRK
jgi:hypothetical protein